MDDVIHIPTHMVDAYVAGLLSEEETASVAAHVGACVDCELRLVRAAEAREAFLRAHPPEIRARQLLERDRRSSRRRWLVPALVGPAVAVALVAILPRLGSLDQAPEVLFKGGELATFEIHRPASDATWSGRSGEVLRAGDAIQIRVAPPRPMHVAVFSMDPAGNVAPLLSLDVSAPTRLPKSLVVDESQDPEQLLVVVSATKLAETEVAAHAREALAAAGGDIRTVTFAGFEPPGAAVVGFLVRKEKPPTTPPSDVPPGK